MGAILLLLVAAAASAHADCEACVGGWCHSRKTLLEGFLITDQMAIDRTNDVLYVQLNHKLNTAYHLKEQRVRLVQELNTTEMTVDQDTQTLYTAYSDSIYKYAAGSKTLVEVFVRGHNVAKWLVQGGVLFYTTKSDDGLHYIDNDGSYHKVPYTFKINDFITVNSSNIYVIADDSLYLYTHEYDDYDEPLGYDLITTTVLKNACKLSKDKFEDVYYSDALLNAIFKLNETGVAVEYAAYENGAVDQFVFDSNNNIVFHNKTDGSVNQWQREDTQCKIEVFSKYVIEKL